MIVGYHHHVPVAFREGVAAFPSHYGVFVEELAREAGSVVFFAYETEPSTLEDMVLDPELVRVVSLGPRPRYPAATYLAPRTWKLVASGLKDVDVLLVRGPGPLLPRLIRLRVDTPRVALMMGSWHSWTPSRANSSLENMLIRGYLRVYNVDQRRAMRGRLVLTNNVWLTRQAAEGADVREVFTSSLSERTLRSLASPRDVGIRVPVRLLYTGRIVEEKGVLDLADIVAELTGRRVDVTLDLFGWAGEGDPTSRLLAERAMELGLGDRIRIGGYRRLEDELVEDYRRADVYVFAGRQEWGMPHAVIEAMAAGLPVVMTEIEGVRGLLEHRKHAMLVPPRRPEALAAAVEEVVRDDSLRQRLSENGRGWAMQRSNEASVRMIVEHLRSVVDTP